MDEDYTAAPTQGGEQFIYIFARQRSGSRELLLTPLVDSIVEGSETLLIGGSTVLPGSGTLLGTGLPVTPVEVTITDSNTLPTGVSLTVAPNAVGEGAGATDLEVTATLTGGDLLLVDTTVDLTLVGVTATVPADFTAAATTTLTINAGESSGTATLTITPVDDTMAEGDETAQVRGAADGLAVDPMGATVTIRDNDADPREVVLTVSPATVGENDGPTVITVSGALEGGVSRSVPTPVIISVHDVTAVVNEDYTATQVVLSIPAGTLSGTATLTLTPLNDNLHEGAEQVVVRAAGPEGFTAAGVRVTITDDDDEPTMITLSLDKDTVAEGEGTQELAVTGTLQGSRRTVDTSVTLTVVGKTATDADYFASPSELVIAAGDLAGTATIVLAPTDDSIDEQDETLEVKGAASEPQLLVSAKQVTIIDDDTAGVTVSTDALAVIEGGSNSYTVVLDTQPTGPVTVAVTVVDTANNDVSVEPETLTFTAANWDTAQRVRVTVADDEDAIDDADVTITHAVSGADYNGQTAAGVTVSITDDDDPAVTVSFGAATYTAAEGDTVEVTVTLSADPERGVTIPLTATNEGEASDADYSGVPDSVVFERGETSKTFTFTAADDDDDDGESVALAFGTLPNRVTAGSVATSTVSITDNDDPAVTASFGSASYTASEGGDVTVTVTLSADPEREVTIPVTATPEDGATAADYSGVPASVVFAIGDTSKTFTFSATDDTDDDDDESVALAFGTLPTGVTEADPKTSTVSITDNDDPAVTVSFGSATYTAAEGGDVTVTVTLSADPERGVTIPLTATNEGEATDADYSGVPTSVVFAIGDTSKTFTFSATDDTDDDDGESVELAFGTLPTGVTAGNVAASTVSITDNDDPAVTASFSSASYTAAEGGDVTVTVTLSADPEREVTILLTKTNEGGATPDDYSGVPASLVFQSGETSKTFTFTAIDDVDDDDGESVTLAFGTLPTGVTEADPKTSTVSITDNDDPAVTASFGSATYTAAEGGDVTVTVTLSADPEREVTILLTKTNEGGASDADYSGVPASVVFAIGETSKTFTFTATDDTDDDDGESVALAFGTLPTGVTEADPKTSTVSITDTDDPAITVSFDSASYTATEGGTVEVTVTLSADPERAVTIPVTATPEGGATADDYSGVPTSLVFAIGETSKTFTFSATDDVDDVDGESVALAFGSLPDRVTAGSVDTSTVSITDNDDPAVTASFGSATYTAAEGGTVEVTVTLSADPEREVTIPVSATGQNGATTADYSGVPASVVFAIGDTSETFTFTATDDTVDDDGENVALAFGTLPARVTAGSVDTSTVSITDNDDPAVTASFGSATYTAAEGGDVTITVTLSADPEREVTILLSATNEGGATTADYSGVPASVVFQSGDTSKTFIFTAAADTVDDDDESVALSFGTLPALVTAGSVATSTVSITDNDDPAVTASFGSATYTAAEGGTVEVTVTLSADPERDVTILLSANGQDGATTADYSGVPASVVFQSGDTSKTFTFSAAADTVDDDGESVALAFGTLPARVTAGSVDTSTVSITDNDDPAVTASFGSATYTAAEGGTVEVTVTLSADPEREVTILLSKTNEGGATTADYSGVPASLVFQSGDTSETFTFSATDDVDDDDGESVALAFGTLPAGVTAGSVPHRR